MARTDEVPTAPPRLVPVADRRNWLEQLLSGAAGRRQEVPVEIKDVLTLREVIDYFVVGYSRNAQVHGGVLFRMPQRRGHEVFLAFIDGDDLPVLDGEGRIIGRQVHAGQVDAELSSCLGPTGLVVFRQP
jgi:hypothetical protein